MNEGTYQGAELMGFGCTETSGPDLTPKYQVRK